MEDENKKLREKIAELNDQIDHMLDGILLCHKEIGNLRIRVKKLEEEIELVKKLEEEIESAAYFRSITPDSLSQS